MRAWAAARWAAFALLLATALAVAGCGTNSNDSAGQPTVTVVKTAPAETSPQTTTGGGQESSTSQGSSGGGAESWTMPDMTGKDLQTAQDAIQSLTNDAIFYTKSHDATGQGRHQILDRDWQVCTQDPAPGSEITADTNIDFGVVRVDTEQCP